MLLALAQHDPAQQTVTSSSSYSRSAIGHGALVAMLRERGYAVAVNRSRLGTQVTADDLLVILEPAFADYDVEALDVLLSGKRRVLVALPKWSGTPSADRSDWIGGVRRVSSSDARKVADAVLRSARASVTEEVGAWPTGAGQPELDRPVLFYRSRVQLFVAGGEGGIVLGESVLDSLVAVDRGILLGRVPGRHIALLSDPDILANHGLHRGDNASLAMAIIDTLMPAGGTVYIDESLHGFALTPSLWRLLFRPPFLAATLLALVAMALAVWRAASRFGAPLESGSRRTTVAFSSGHATLIENGGRLLVSGGHKRYIAERYCAVLLAEASRRLHLRGGRTTGELRAALNAIAHRRGVSRAAAGHRLGCGGAGPGAPIPRLDGGDVR